MKNLFFALLACLLTACFRAPHFSNLPSHRPVTSATGVAAPLPPDREMYASAAEAAAAGTFTPETGETAAAPAAKPAYAPASGAPPASLKAKPAARPVHLRRELRKAVRAVMRHKQPVAGTQDNPAPAESALPTVALIAGIVGIIGLVGTFAASLLGLGAIGGGLFLLGFLGGLLAIILGGIAKGRIRRGQDAESGRGKATAGLIMGIVNLSVVFLLVILALLIAIALSGGR